mmetsp:Transcript_25889/g.56141  ORF Transcript_25889/g.56141 Transcript_25889/m.56141 type:complete len:84 (+) Transcript_25889:112-363(+)
MDTGVDSRSFETSGTWRDDRSDITSPRLCWRKEYWWHIQWYSRASTCLGRGKSHESYRGSKIIVTIREREAVATTVGGAHVVN